MSFLFTALWIAVECICSQLHWGYIPLLCLRIDRYQGHIEGGHREDLTLKVYRAYAYGQRQYVTTGQRLAYADSNEQ